MIHSMTGFGEAAIDQGGLAFHVSIRSVNNRYFKPSLRLPEEMSFLEPTLEQVLRKRVTRGSVTLRLDVRDLSETAAQPVNLAAIRHYVEQLRTVMDGEKHFTIDLATLATLPGVCQPQDISESQREDIEALVVELTDKAAARLTEMRAVEGRALATDLKQHCEAVRKSLAAIAERGGGVVEEYRKRLMQRVEQLIAGSNVTLAQDDLVREVAVFAERSDISEEITRLRSHLEQFEAAFSLPEPAGRKLDFISQEMLREANTIGSKAGDASIARHTIEIKAAIDRIKEQVQNVE